MKVVHVKWLLKKYFKMHSSLWRILKGWKTNFHLTKKKQFDVNNKIFKIPRMIFAYFFDYSRHKKYYQSSRIYFKWQITLQVCLFLTHLIESFLSYHFIFTRKSSHHLIYKKDVSSCHFILLALFLYLWQTDEFFHYGSWNFFNFTLQAITWLKTFWLIRMSLLISFSYFERIESKV